MMWREQIQSFTIHISVTAWDETITAANPGSNFWDWKDRMNKSWLIKIRDTTCF